MENGKDEEDEALEDSFGEQPGPPVQLRNPGTKKPPPEGRAPTMTIEMVRVGRPKKVLALLAAIISLILFGTSFASTSWLHTESHRIGLLQRCPRESASFSPADAECTVVQMSSPLDLRPWRTRHSIICLALGAGVLLFTLLGIIFFLAGIITMSLKPKTAMYKTVLAFNTIAVLTLVACLVFFPLGHWLWPRDPGAATSIGWSFYLGCASAVLLLVAIVLLALDRKSEEVAYKEIISRT